MRTAMFLGGRQAGCVGLLTMLAAGYAIRGVVAYDSLVSNLASKFGLPIYGSIKRPEVAELLRDCDVLVSVHCREIVPKELLDLPRVGSVNAHPCLFLYKGSSPVQKLIRDKGKFASVGVHRMTEVVDEGEVLSELYTNVEGAGSVKEVYNELYPFYSMAILDALRKLEE